MTDNPGGRHHYICSPSLRTRRQPVVPNGRHPGCSAPPPPPAGSPPPSLSPPPPSLRPARLPPIADSAVPWKLMDRLDERSPRGTSTPATARQRKHPVFLKASTFHHHDPPTRPAREPHKVGNGGFFSPGAASPKPLPRRRPFDDPPFAGSETSVALPFRRSSSSAGRSGKAFARRGGGGVPKAVFYSTSLRGIRRTYEDCCTVRNILRGFRLAVDERDVSMDAGLRKELQRSLGGGAGKPPVTLPQVFVGEKWLGGAEEIRQLHECGELGKLLEGVPRQDPRFVCRSCGGVRFVPCCSCSGSRKVFDEDEGQLRRCPDCNENGLVRCPDCV